MVTNSRNVKPYFSSIKLVLFPGYTSVAVQDQQGRQGTQLVDEKPQIKTTITGWMNNQVVRQDVFVFDAEPVDGPSMTDVLEAAKEIGIDVAEAWSGAFDQVAEIFPATKDQEASASTIGPQVYLRADAFEAQLHPTQKKSVTMKVGVYSDVEYTNLQTYLNLTFEDGDTKREREAYLAQLNNSKRDIEVSLSRLELLVAARLANQGTPVIPGFQYSEYILSQTTDQLKDLVKQQQQDLVYRTKQVADQNQVLNGDLSLLLGNDNTPLQQTISASVGALCTAILRTLKETHPDYANIDVAQIMSEFATPDVS